MKLMFFEVARSILAVGGGAGGSRGRVARAQGRIVVRRIVSRNVVFRHGNMFVAVVAADAIIMTAHRSEGLLTGNDGLDGGGDSVPFMRDGGI